MDKSSHEEPLEANQDQEKQIDPPIELDDANRLDLPDQQSTPTQPSFKPAKTKRKFPLKKVAVSLLLILVIAATAYGAYDFFGKDKSAAPGPTATSSDYQTSQSPSTSTTSELTESYVSNSLRLEFMHPADWTVEEANKGILIQSPPFRYESKDKGEVEGKFTLYIRKGARSADGAIIGDGYAISPSTKLVYSSPASGQREETWLTNFGLKSPDNFAFFIVQGNFELKKNGTLGPNFAKEADAYLIFGGYTETDQENELKTVTMPVDGFDATDQYKTAVEIVQSLKLK